MLVIFGMEFVVCGRCERSCVRGGKGPGFLICLLCMLHTRSMKLAA